MSLSEELEELLILKTDVAYERLVTGIVPLRKALTFERGMRAFKMKLDAIEILNSKDESLVSLKIENLNLQKEIEVLVAIQNEEDEP